MYLIRELLSIYPNRSLAARRKLLIFSGLLFLLCLTGYGQASLATPVTLSAKDKPLKEIFKELEQKTGFTINYQDDVINASKAVSIEARQQPLTQVLDRLLNGSNATFTQQGSMIVLVKKAAAPKKDPGKVSGKIVDEENGQPISGATIRIGSKGVTTDIDGNFSIALPKGNYTATVSYVGYGTKEVNEIDVKDNQTLALDITLKREKGSLAGVIVKASARKEGVAALYARQKNAAGITDGISAEQIAKTPDKNIGEVLKRVSGVSTTDNKYVVVRGLSERYNGSMLNGQLMPSTELNRKQFSFDIIPSNLIDNVVVYKTVTPDMNAEFGGGVVSVNTISVPAQDFFTITAGSSYNDKTTGKNFKGLLIENKQYLGGIPDNRKLMGANWESRKDVVQAFDASKVPNNWALYNYQPNPSQNYQLSGGKIISLKNNRRIGFIGAASYRNTWQTQDVRMSRNGYEGQTPDGELVAFTGNRYGFTTNVGALAGAGYQGNNSKISWQSIYLSTLDQQLVFGTGWHEPVGKAVGYYDLFTQTRLWQHQLKGEHLLDTKGMKLSWAGSYINMDKQKPDNHLFAANYADMDKDSPLEPVDFSITRAMSNIVDGALRTWSRAKEKNLSWNTDLAIPFHFNIGKAGFVNTVRTGYAGWSKQRSFWVVNTSSGYNTGSNQPLSEYFEPSLHPGGKAIELNQFGDDMNKTASLHAGYAMLDHKIANKWRLVWGLRAEYYNMNKVNQLLDSAFSSLNSGRGPSDQFDYSAMKNREPNWNFFPSANLTYSLTPKMNLRLAYAKSIIRPDLRELSFFKEYDFELGGVYQSISPVRSTIMQHYDFRYEWYPAAGEVISVSLFYKKLDYPMEIFKMGANREYELRNSKSAKNKGIEVEIRKSLAFTKIPVVKNITLYGNFTWLDATVVPMSIGYNLANEGNIIKVESVEQLGDEEKRPQSGASNYMVNAGVYYDIRLLSLNVSYNYVTNRMYRPDLTYRESLFERPLQALDAQVSVNLLKQKMQVKLNAGNLLGSNNLVYRNFFSNPDISNGITPPSTKDLLYQKGEDVIDYEAAPGRTYGLSVSYRF